MKESLFKYLVAFVLLSCHGIYSSALSIDAAGCSSAVSVTDSSQFNALKIKLDEYCMAMSRESFKTQGEECDFLIESTRDSILRQFVATYLYDRFISSKVMGAEGVAIHIFDRWFASRTVVFEDEIRYLDAKIQADFNRNSLIGCKASELTLEDEQGMPYTLFPSEGESIRRFSILFFYDTECSKCKVETILLRSLIENEDYPVDFYPIYTGDNRESWDEYRKTRFDIQTKRTRIKHLWDPTNESDFQHKWGILQTPGLFLVAPDGTITGRRLDARALAQMLSAVFSERALEYGNEASLSLMNQILGGDEKNMARPSEEDVIYFADRITDQTLERGDTVMFRQMTGDLLYYLASNSCEGSREGMKYLIDNNITHRRDVWKSSDDSLKVIGLACMMDDLLSRAVRGSRLPKIKVPGLLETAKSCRERSWNIRNLRGRTNIILFYTEGCHVCDAQKAAAKSLLASRVNVLYVNVDEITSSNPELSQSLFENFDLTVLPYILVTDRKGRVQRRYIDMTNTY